ncbi:MAG: QueT transporter family protein [Halanaerobiales bacterium]
MNLNAKQITKIAAIAALYAVLTVILAPISYGPIQVRISEALTLLPFFMGSPSAIGLWIGCMLANYIGGYGPIDIIFGAGITLIAGLLTARSRNFYVAGIYPVLLNAFGVALILFYQLEVPYWITALQVGVGQFIAVYIFGIILMKLLKKYDFFERIDEIK